ncbi:MAG: T9SS type A sorting domain-containing protein [Chitinophagales bacterium]|nr:T9SS type A sorting domain-containing protein [Chitinophagales bacterium]
MKKIFSAVLILIINSTTSFSQFTNVLIDDSGNPNEPGIFVNPKNTQQIIAGANLNFTYNSNDGGFTWSKHEVSSSFGVWGDPCMMADTSGNFYYFHLSNPSNGNWIDRIVCQKSVDGGNTWSNGSYTGLNGNKAQDKEWACFDKKTQTIYITWTQFDSYGSSNPNDSSQIMFSKTTDLGLTWTTPVRINRLAGDCIDSDNTSEGAVPAVGANGEVYVCWSNRDTLFFDRSTDGGATWLNEDIVASTQPGGWDYNISGIYRCNGLPITKTDLSGGENNGTIYINWTDQRNGESNTDVFISKSVDGGFTWSNPLKVNDDTTTNQQFFSWMDVDQTTGFIYVLFYDRRNYTDKKTDVYLAYSIDGAQSFTNVKVSENSFTPNTNVFFGDYTNISVYAGKIAPIWARQDGSSMSVWTAQIDIATLAEAAPVLQPNHFMLYQNSPNPFFENTTIEMNIEIAGYYSLAVYNVLGRKVADVKSKEFFSDGHHQLMLDATKYKLNGGVYYYSLSRGNEVMTKQLVIVNQ